MAGFIRVDDKNNILMVRSLEDKNKWNTYHKHIDTRQYVLQRLRKRQIEYDYHEKRIEQSQHFLDTGILKPIKRYSIFERPSWEIELNMTSDEDILNIYEDVFNERLHIL
jgi:hypothetical protein